MRALRNVAIVMALAFAVAFAPHGGNVVEAVFAALILAMLCGIAWTLYALGRQNQLLLASLDDGRRMVLYGSLGLLVLLVAGYDKLFSSGLGTLLWILLFCAAVAAIVRVWLEANSS